MTAITRNFRYAFWSIGVCVLTGIFWTHARVSPLLHHHCQSPAVIKTGPKLHSLFNCQVSVRRQKYLHATFFNHIILHNLKKNQNLSAKVFWPWNYLQFLQPDFIRLMAAGRNHGACQPDLSPSPCHVPAVFCQQWVHCITHFSEKNLGFSCPQMTFLKF